MEADTPESTMDQLVHAAVVTHLDNNPTLTQQLAALPAQAVGQVQQQLQGGTAPAPATTDATAPSSAEKVEQLTAWVLGELETDQLPKSQRDRIAEVVALRVGYDIDRLKRIMGMDVDSWKRLPQLKVARDQRANRQDLGAMTGITDFKTGFVTMGKDKVDEGPLLWTGGLAGCLGVVVVSGASCFLAHYGPDQVNHEPLADGSSFLDITMADIAGKITLGGANYWLVSQVPGIGYYRAFQRAMAQRGATLAGEFNTTTLAVRTADGAVFSDFKPPPGFTED